MSTDTVNPNKALWEKGDFTRIAQSMRESGEALESLLAIGPGAELIRLNGDYGESRRSEIAAALREHYAAWQRPDGSIVGRASVWIVAADNPG